MSDKAEDLAFGRWPDILTARGMDSAFFSGRNGPCPFCGVKQLTTFGTTLDAIPRLNQFRGFSGLQCPMK